MVHIGTTAALEPLHDIATLGSGIRAGRQPVLIVRDDGADNELLDAICEFLDLDVEHISIDDDFAPMINALRPVAVIADLVGETQDGYHIMKVTASYDRDLPILLLTGGDQTLLGAVDAVAEIWGLTRVEALSGGADATTLVDFLCDAARDTGLRHMIRA